jgi:hypothetical protein
MIFSWPLFLKTFVIGEWLVNYTYINEFLCEKRFEKENQCKGSCHLNAHLNKVENESEEASQSSKSRRIIEVEYQNFLTVSFQAGISLLPDNRVSFLVLNQIRSHQSILSGIFHPPQFS